jgi:hypothetical protein
VIANLNASLKAFLQGEATPGSELAGSTISFSAPTKDWRAAAAGLLLDVYLYQVVENRELRSNERRFVRATDGSITREPFPARIECTYLITAWNKEQPPAGGGLAAEPEHKEHRLLSQVLYVLMRNATLPRGYWVPGLSSQLLDLPMISAHPDTATAGMPDFWTGLETYLRPAINCRITLSLDLKLSVIGPMVTTTVVGVGVAVPPDRIDRMTSDELYLVGGIVRSTGPNTPAIAAAWVRIDQTGQFTTTDADGRFVLEHLAPGAYSLTVGAAGFQAGGGPVSVPQLPSGSFDVSLVPI